MDPILCVDLVFAMAVRAPHATGTAKWESPRQTALRVQLIRQQTIPAVRRRHSPRVLYSEGALQVTGCEMGRPQREHGTLRRWDGYAK